jgi:uncharacterized OB-fold protein
MGVISAISAWTTHTASTDDDCRVRCRNCGRYYDAVDDLCPHCGSGNQIRSGAPSGQTRR